jgi:DNA-binding PadR family transcriptional regulator
VNLAYPTAVTLEALAAGHRDGFGIMQATGLPSGTVYPLLRRLARKDFVVAKCEAEAYARRLGRPPRCEYRLTLAGRAELARARQRFGILLPLATELRFA